MAKQADSPKLRTLNVEQTLLAEDVVVRHGRRWTDVQFEEEVQSTFTVNYEGWNFNNGNYLFTTDTKCIHVSKFYSPSM